MSHPVASRTRWTLAVVYGLLGALAVTVLVLAFLWPSKTATPHDLPIGIAGPVEAVAAFQGQLEQGPPSPFALVPAADRADAVSQIEARATYGAIVLDATGVPEVLTAPAGSGVAAQLLGGVAAQMQAQSVERITASGGDPSAAVVTVTPVVPLAPTDPTGAGLGSASFPLTIGGMIGGILVSLLVGGPLRRLAALAGFAVATGLALALVLQTWFQYLQGDLLVNAAGLGLSVLATSAFIVGLGTLLGQRWIALGAVITVLVGNPLAGAAAPWQFTPAPWGAIGQYLVPGAANSLIRTLSYFPSADASPQWLILTGWTVLGTVLIVIAHARQGRTRTASSTSGQPVAVLAMT